MTKKNILTGIKPTGEPHLGNYLGAIKPALALAEQSSFNARYFIADYHALNTVKEASLLKNYSTSIAATWLACGLNPSKVLFYRQSDIPEIFELAILLTAFTAKGLMNRAHAYKAAVVQNQQEGQTDDHQINMGLFNYPILMAADILLFDTHCVPVGKDQKQHIEMTQDIAGSINFNYKKELLITPQPIINEETEVIMGLDGRKMSKSYHNVIPLFCSSKQLKKLIATIVTNSQGIDEPKDPASSAIFSLYQHFASVEQSEELAKRYRAGGMGWGHAKEALFELLDVQLAPLRERYDYFMNQPVLLQQYLEEGATKARIIAKEKMRELRLAIGLD